MSRKFFFGPLLLVLAAFGLFLLITDPDSQGKPAIRSFNRDREQAVFLSGEWQFYAGEFIEPGNFNQLPTASFTSGNHLLTWNDLLLNQSPWDSKGPGTYRIRLTTDRLGEWMGLHMDTLPKDSVVYINGQQGGEPQAVKKIPRLIRTGFLGYFQVDSSEIEIVIHTANQSYYLGGIEDMPMLGTLEQLHHGKEAKQMTKVLLITALLLMSVFVLVIFRASMEKLSLFYFVMTCACNIGCFLSDNLIVRFRGSTNFMLASVFIDVMVVLVILFLDNAGARAIIKQNPSPFIRRLFSEKVVYAVCGLFLFFSALAGLGLYPQESQAYSYMIHFFVGLSIAYLIAKVLYCAWKAFPRLNSFAVVSVIYAFSGVFHFESYSLLFIQPVFLSGLLTSVFMFSILSRDYLDKMRQLKIFSNEMEELVKARTTQLATANQELTRSYKRLSKMEKELREMMANIAHDLRTPVTSIAGALQILNDKTTGELAPLVQMAHTSAAMLALRVNDLFEISRINTGGIHLDAADINVRQMMHEIADYYTTEFDQGDKEIFFATEFSEEGADLIIHGDYNRLFQVFENLIQNAKRMVPDQSGKIIMGYYGKDQRVIFYVEDNGIGIAPKDQEMVFDKFFVTDISRNAKKNGSGLGLAIAKGLVELHQGEIWMTSAPGQGSTFFFSIPAKS